MSPDDVVDRFSGMIDKGTAATVAARTHGAAGIRAPAPHGPYTVSSLLEIMASRRSGVPKTLLGSVEGPETVSVRDHLYRVFNPMSYERAGKQLSRRTVVLGTEGSALKLNLREKLSSFIDINAFERGDLVMAANVSLDMKMGELSDASGTSISRVEPSHNADTVCDYSALRPDMRNVDIVGMVTEIGPIRYVERMGGRGQVAAATCVMTDLNQSINASLWGSSAIATARMSTSNFVKLEFCATRERNGTVEVYANDLSRVASCKSFASLLHRRAQA